MTTYTVGEEVGFGRHGGRGFFMSHGFSRITKINHHGHIHLENGRVFDRHGRERKCQYGEAHLMDAQMLRDQLAAIAERRERANIFNELKSIMDNQRNGYGDVCALDDATRERMIALVNKL